MKSVIKTLGIIALSLIIVFTSVGYAAVTETLDIHGSAEYSPPSCVFISNVELYSVNLATTSAYSTTLHTTTLDTTVDRNSRSSNGTVTYAVTFFNNTPYKYGYTGLEYQKSLTGYNGNSYLQPSNNRNGITVTTKDSPNDSSNTFNAYDVLNPGEHRVVYVTYTIGRSITDTAYKTLVNFEFGVNVASVGEVAIDAAFEQFKKILNDTAPGGGYQTLIDKIDDKYDGVNDWKANYIGNVTDSSSADTATIETLFEGKLKITIDQVETNITLLIKREDVDGNDNTGDSYTATYNNKSVSDSGCEMTLYMTTSELDNSETPVVYAAVFTCDVLEDGTYSDWYMIGDSYIGTASVVGYEGEYTSGSFDTGTWRSRDTSYTAGDYTYRISSGNTIQTITKATDQNARNALRPMLQDAHDIIEGKYGDLGGEAVAKLNEVYTFAEKYFTVSSNGTVSVNTSVTRSHIVPIIKQLEVILESFADIIS